MLLDFGQCKALTAQRQRALAKLMIALDQGWPDRVVAAMSGMGLDFSDGQGGGANPLLVTIVANIMFDTKYDPLLQSPTSALPVALCAVRAGVYVRRGRAKVDVRSCVCAYFGRT